MSRYVDLDEVIPMLRDIRKTTTDETKRALIDAFIIFTDFIQCEHREKLRLCHECWYYDEKSRHCIHYRGLSGRVEPNFFCSWSSLNETKEGDIDDITETFEEFSYGD